MKWTAADIPSAAGKIAVVTGANSGLGLETAAGLAGAGATVIMACRDPGRGAAALAQVQGRAPGATVQLMPLDLSDLGSVRRFAQEFVRTHPRLDLLCNNAGVMAVPLQRTKDGFEMQIGTNHLGHFALTGLLLDSLMAAPAARVVNVASLAHRWATGFDPEDLHFERRKYRKWVAYSYSKLANLLFTFELSRRLARAAPRMIAAAAHPGYSATNLQFVGPQQENSAIGRLFMKIGNGLFGQPAAMGALPTLYAATMPGVANGDYFGPDGFQQIQGHPRKVGCREDARDPALASRLWTASEQATGVRYLSA